MVQTPITIDKDSDHGHIQISTEGIGIKSRNDKILVMSRNGDIWITAIDYDGKSAAVNIDRDTLRELMHEVETHIL